MWSNTSSVGEREVLIRALCCIECEELLPDLFNFILTAIPAQDIHIAATVLGSNLRMRKAFWNLIRLNFTAVTAAMKGNITLIGRFLKGALENTVEDNMAEEIDSFFREKDIRGYDRILKNIQDVVSARLLYKKRDADNIKGWLGSWVRK